MQLYSAKLAYICSVKLHKLYKLLIIISVITPLVSVSQSATYKESLKKDIVLFQSAKTANDLVYAANCFEKLAIIEKREWLPFYYAGLCDVLAAFEKQNKDIDTYCDKAEIFARKADSLSKNNSEVAVLKSMIAAARINVNKAQRGPKFGLLAARYAEDALKLDNSNPRAYVVKGKVVLNSPKILGGGEKKAKPIFELAMEKMKTYKSESNLHPSWGSVETEQELKKINLSSKK